jgi:hypothetical protein
LESTFTVEQAAQNYVSSQKLDIPELEEPDWTSIFKNFTENIKTVFSTDILEKFSESFQGFVHRRPPSVIDLSKLELNLNSLRKDFDTLKETVGQLPDESPKETVKKQNTNSLDKKRVKTLKKIKFKLGYSKIEERESDTDFNKDEFDYDYDDLKDFELEGDKDKDKNSDTSITEDQKSKNKKADDELDLSDTASDDALKKEKSKNNGKETPSLWSDIHSNLKSHRGTDTMLAQIGITAFDTIRTRIKRSKEAKKEAAEKAKREEERAKRAEEREKRRAEIAERQQQKQQSKSSELGDSGVIPSLPGLSTGKNGKGQGDINFQHLLKANLMIHADLKRIHSEVSAVKNGTQIKPLVNVNNKMLFAINRITSAIDRIAKIEQARFDAEQKSLRSAQKIQSKAFSRGKSSVPSQKILIKEKIVENTVGGRRQ